MSDVELILRTIGSDDHAAFGELVQRHQSAVRRFLRHLTRGDDALADDLAQETFVHAWQRLRDFHGGSTFSTWLLGIAHNHWRNARRKLLRDRPDDASRPECTIESSITYSDLTHDLASALELLSADERLAVHLCYQQGLSHSEISALLDWPLGTVKTHLARAKKNLRPLLSSWNQKT